MGEVLGRGILKQRSILFRTIRATHSEVHGPVKGWSPYFNSC